MAIQLGLDGGIKLIGHGDEDAMREVLAYTAPRYADFVKAIDVGETDKAVYWRIIFSILSVHSPIDATFEAYRALRLWRARFGRFPRQATAVRIIRNARGTDGVVQYQNQKADYVCGFDEAWRKDSTLFTRNGESDDAWRLRLQRNVRGLGLAKASFAVALAAPATSDVCCIDTHMFALFTDGRPPSKMIGKRAYLAIEERVRKLAHEFNLSTFACQWALWDARRGVTNPHTALAAL